MLEPVADFVLKLPLIAEKEEQYVRHGKFTMYRKPGDVLNPTAMTAGQAAKLKASLPGYVWDGQYQQRPTAGGSGMLSVERFQRFDLSKPPKFELSIHSWDVGATIGGNASVCTKWGLAPNKNKKDALHLTQVISVRLELPGVLAAIKAEIERDRPAQARWISKHILVRCDEGASRDWIGLKMSAIGLKDRTLRARDP
jgi:hypothetical protein